MQAVHVELCLLKACHEKVDHALGVREDDRLPVLLKMHKDAGGGPELVGTTHVNEHHAHVGQVDFVLVGLHELGVAHEFRGGVDDFLGEGRGEEKVCSRAVIRSSTHRMSGKKPMSSMRSASSRMNIVGFVKSM